MLAGYGWLSSENFDATEIRSAPDQAYSETGHLRAAVVSHTALSAALRADRIDRRHATLESFYLTGEGSNL